MMFDSALTALATGALNFASIFNTCKIGSSAASNSTPGNTVTFTQVGTTITASGSFFTAAMVGAIFKYSAGSAGAEQYIATVAGGGLTCTVSGAGMTVAVATAGTVWYVQQTALTTPLTGLTGGCVTQNYVTSPGACGTSFPGGANSTQVALTRTWQFPVQASTYTVNEIGYSDNNTNNGGCNGRIVLGTGDTITNTEYYVVQMVITYTQTPNVPTASLNTGTGINNAGQIMFQCWDIYYVTNTGGALQYQTNVPPETMDGTGNFKLAFTGTAPTLKANISQTQMVNPAVNYVSSAGAGFTNSGLGVGVAQTTISFNLSTAGETINAVIFGTGSTGGFNQAFVLNLTTPYTLPSGSFNGNFVYQRAVTRTLSN